MLTHFSGASGRASDHVAGRIPICRAIRDPVIPLARTYQRRCRFSILAGFIVAANNIAAVDQWRSEMARTSVDNDNAAIARRSRRHARMRTRVGKTSRGARAPAA